MATTDLVPTSIIATVGSWAGATVANLEASDNARATGGAKNDTIRAEITNSPGDFGSQNSVTISIEARTSGSTSRDRQLQVDLLDSADTILESFTTTVLTTTDAVYTSSVRSRSDSQAVINGYRVLITVIEGGGMADSQSVEIDHVFVTLDYEVSSGTSPIDGSSSLTTTAAGTLKGIGRISGVVGHAYTTAAMLRAVPSPIGQGAVGEFTLGAFAPADYNTEEAPETTAITGTTSLAFTTTAAIAGTGKLAGTTGFTFANAGEPGGEGALAGTTSLGFTLAGTIAGSGALSGASSITWATTGAIAAGGALAGSAAVSFTTAGSMSGSGALAGVSPLAFGAAGTISATGALAGSSSLTFTGSATAASDTALAGSTSVSFDLTANLTATAALSGTVAFTTTAAATASAKGSLAALTSLAFAAAGNAVGVGALAGTASLTFATSAAAAGGEAPEVAPSMRHVAPRTLGINRCGV